MPNEEAFADLVAVAMQACFTRSIAPIVERMAAIETRLGEFRQPKDGEPGPAGKDADPEIIEALTIEIAHLRTVVDKQAADLVELTALQKGDAQVLMREIQALPAPKDGAPGRDADPVDYAQIAAIVKNEVAECVASLPPAKDGANGKDADMDAVLGAVKTHVMHALAEIPPPKDGEPGPAGKDAPPIDPAVVDDLVANHVALIPKSPASFFVDESGELVAVYPDGETKKVGAVRGKDGIRGASIMDGSVDESGQLVLRMSDGRIINAGAVRGEAGRPGNPGAAGSPGRDATEIRILTGIDESRSYPEGTTALHRGGMIRAERQTDPVVDGKVLDAGWRVALEGIADESENELADGRYVERTTTYTSGRVFTRRMQSAGMIYRGIYKEGDSYERGDVVTWGGSAWHCNAMTDDAPGAGSPSWRLAVKKGNDGKHGEKGERGAAHPPGPNGASSASINGGKI